MWKSIGIADAVQTSASPCAQRLEATERRFPQLSWKGSQVPMEARRKPWIPAINYTNTWHYKIILAHQILSHLYSAITLSVISTLELFEAVTDGGQPCQVFLQVRIWATGEGSVRAAREGKGRVTEVMKLKLMLEAWQKNKKLPICIPASFGALNSLGTGNAD